MTLKLFLVAQAQTDFVQRLQADLRENACQFVPRFSLADRIVLIDEVSDDTLRAVRSECKPIVRIWRDAAAAPHPEALDFRLEADYIPRFDQLLKRLRQAPVPLGTLHNLPDLPEIYLERPELQNVYRSLLQRDERVNAIVSKTPPNAVIGIGGIGKSTLANALCRLCEVRREFYDGVIWITLGEDGQLLSALKVLGVILDVPSEALSENRVAQARLSQELAARRCLIVLDDVWDHKIAETFKQLVGSASHLLITTRKSQIAHLLGARTDTLDALSAEQGADLLCSYVPSAPRALALQVAELLGGHPLAIFIAARWINTPGSGRDAQRLLERLHEGKTFETLNIAQDDRNLHLERSLRLSYDDLSESDRAHFRYLGALAPNASFDLAALADLWQLDQRDAEERAVALLSAGLLTRDEKDKRYRMHSLLHAYAYKLLEEAQELQTAQRNHFEHFFAKRERQRAERAQLSADLPNILRALDFALDYDPRAAVDWTMKLAKPMRGMPTAERRALLEQGLEAARRTSNTVGEAFLLRALYDVVRQPEARARYRQQALDAFAQLERAAGTARGAQRAITFQVHALLQKELRNFDEARRLFKRAVEADPFNAPAWQAYALFEKEQRNFAEARRLFKRAVEADPSHAPAWQAYALFEKEQRQYDEARRLFKRAVEANPLDAPSWQAYALFEKEQRNFDEARRLLEEGLRHVRDGRGKGLLHSTLGGLLAGGGDLAAAESHFRKALEYDDRNALTHYHFATKVLLRTDRRAEACRHLCRAKALRIKKPHEREMIEKALERNGCQCNGSR
jgi:tetratricopeptide (TPR) repeat protein